MHRYLFASCFVNVIAPSPVSAVDSATDLVAPPAAALSNYERIPLGSYGAIEGGVIIARGEGAESTWYNPAGLTRATDDTVSANTSIFGVDNLSTETGSEGNDDANLVQIPSFVGANLIFRSGEEDGSGDIGVGLVLTTPIQWRQTSDFQEDQVGSDGVISTATRNVFINYNTVVGGIGFGNHLSEGFRWGLAGWLGLTTYDSIRSFSVRQRANNGSPVSSEVTSTAIRANAVHIRASFGIQWDLHQRWSLGIHVRSPGIELYQDARLSYDLFENDGTTSVDGTLTDQADFTIYQAGEIGLGLAYRRGKF